MCRSHNKKHHYHITRNRICFTTAYIAEKKTQSPIWLEEEIFSFVTMKADQEICSTALKKEDKQIHNALSGEGCLQHHIPAQRP